MGLALLLSVVRQFLNHCLAQNPKGIGLGLWICRRLVELQGGTIALEDEKSKDAAFKMQFPLQHEA